jgi:ubiquinone/menaquinone biosynthesis C-methylase UbiE
MYALPFETSAFDTVAIGHVLAGAERPAEVLTEAARALRQSGRLLVVERFDDIEACTGANPLQTLRQWLDRGGLHLARLRPCDLASGHHLLALAHRAP